MLLAYLRGLQQPRSWAWPAAFGLAFFAMSGMNVAVVPLYQLLALVPIAAVALWHRRATWRQVLAVTAKCGLFVVAVSVYWLVPATAALGTGAQIVDMSETLTGIHKVSSFTEVLRGLGLWPLYGHSDTGPWVPQNATYAQGVADAHGDSEEGARTDARRALGPVARSLGRFVGGVSGDVGASSVQRLHLLGLVLLLVLLGVTSQLY